jgi:hypothetical protein
MKRELVVNPEFTHDCQLAYSNALHVRMVVFGSVQELARFTSR